MASIQYVVNATDAASGVFAKIAASADGLDKQLEDLGRRVADPEVNLEDSKFTLGMIRAAERLDKLSAQVADPSVEVDTAKAQVEILRINAMLDRLDAKRVNVTVDVDRRGGIFARLGGLFGRGRAGAGGALAAPGAALAGLGAGASAASPYALTALAVAAALTGPALLPVGLAGLAGGGGAAGALALGGAADKQLTALQKSLQTATGARRRQIQQQIAALRQSRGPELAAYGGLENIGNVALRTFATALTSPGAIPGARGGMGGAAGAAGPSFLASLSGILKQIAGFIKTIGPSLGDMFRASVPYLKAFVGFLEQAAKVLLPVFTQMLLSMRPYLPLIAKGMMNIVGGIAGFLKAIGPSGMQASAKIFVALTKAMAVVLVGLGHTINWLAEHIPTWVHNIAAWWDRLFHWTVTTFDNIRHHIASFFHGVAADFDAFRHGWAHTWDTIYSDTIGMVIRIDRGIIGWFAKLPGQAVRALWGFGHQLAAFARAAMSEMWAGIRSVGSGILGWFGSFVSKIVGFFSRLLHHSPTGDFYHMGRNMMEGLAMGLKDHAHLVSAQMDRVSGALGGDALANQALARRIFPWGAAQWPSFVSLVMAESGFNRFARNPSSGAYGIAQALPPTKYPFAGQAAGGSHAGPQLSWMFAYIASRYGTPAGAWAHELAYHWYDRGGWLPPGVTLAVNRTGVPERVLAPGSGGNTYQITVNVPPTANKADIGRQVVETIREYEKRSGPGWRK
jgi:hypothetical protein